MLDRFVDAPLAELAVQRTRVNGGDDGAAMDAFARRRVGCRGGMEKKKEGKKRAEEKGQDDDR